MEDLGKWATGIVITVLIGGTAYTINSGAVINNFANDTGLTQEQAEQYINSIPEDELVPFDEIGRSEMEFGQSMLDGAAEIDCMNYEYEWESANLSCQSGKMQMKRIGNTSIALGQAYVKLSSDSASRDDILRTISLLDEQNSELQLPILSAVLEWSAIDEERKTNSFNKAILQAALESE